MKKYLLFFLFCLVVSLAPAAAEVTECINSSSTSCPSGIAIRNITLTTGFQGSTVLSCNSNADCKDTGWFKCFSDWDGTGPDASNTGWCNSTAITSCYSNGTSYNTTYNFCVTSTAYRVCTSGSWGSETACSSNQTCTSGLSSPCAASTSSSSSSSSSSGSGSNATPTPKPTAAPASTLSITAPITDFELVQNESAVKSLIVKNIGNKSLIDVKLAISGLEGVRSSVSPEKVANFSAGTTATFIVNFSASANATVKPYTVTTEASSGDTKTSATFTLKILPSNATIENTIIPLYDSLKSLLADMERNVTELEKQGINTTAMRRLLSDIKDKLNQTENNLQKKNYFEAAQLMDSAKTLFADLQASITQAKAPGFDFLLILIIVVVVAGAGILAYMLWPTKEEGFQNKNWKWKPAEKEESMIERIAEKIKRKKKDSYGA